MGTDELVFLSKDELIERCQDQARTIKGLIAAYADLREQTQEQQKQLQGWRDNVSQTLRDTQKSMVKAVRHDTRT